MVAGDVGERVDVLLGDLVPVAEVPSSSPSAAFSSSSPVIVVMAAAPYLARRWPAPLLVVDAPHLLYRAFFALPTRSPSADGQPGQRAARLGQPDAVVRREATTPRAVVMCFGAEAAEYRVEAFPAYHADRPPMPDGAGVAVGAGAGALRGARLDGARPRPDLEADDLLHSLAAPRSAAGGTDADPHRRPRHVPVRERRPCTCCCSGRASDGPDEVGPDGGAREATASSPSRCRTSSRCAATRRTGCRAPRASAPKTAADLLQRKGDLEHVILGAIREKPSVRRALIEQADELRSFKDIATLRDGRRRAPARPRDRLGGRREGGGASSAWAGSPSGSRSSPKADLTQPQLTFGAAPRPHPHPAPAAATDPRAA